MGTQIKEYTGRYEEFINAMPDCNARNYIVSRVIPQMNYYSKNSKKNQYRFRLFSIISIICNGIIPVLVIFGEKLSISSWTEIGVTILSTTSGILAAIAALMTYRELWLKYRLALEQLKSILDRYFVRSGEFFDIRNDEDACLNLLEKMCSATMDEEHSAWKELVSIDRSDK